MKRSYKLIDLDCAQCAAKMEDAINKIEGVQMARISFMAQRLTITADQDRFGEIMDQAVQVCRRIEPDCTLVI